MNVLRVFSIKTKPKITETCPNLLCDKLSLTFIPCLSFPFIDGQLWTILYTSDYYKRGFWRLLSKYIPLKQAHHLIENRRHTVVEGKAKNLEWIELILFPWSILCWWSKVANVKFVLSIHSVNTQQTNKFDLHLGDIGYLNYLTQGMEKIWMLQKRKIRIDYL